jgi:hypothetical protein
MMLYLFWGKGNKHDINNISNIKLKDRLKDNKVIYV